MNKTIMALVSLVILTGCSSAREQLGLVREAPDEFAVVKRAPLALPPDYSLRPPRPGAPRPQEDTPTEQARSAVFGTQGRVQQSTTYRAGSEGALLRLAGANDADPNIREKVDQDTYQVDESKTPVMKKLFGIGDDPEEEAEVIDPKEEAERLRKEQENVVDDTSRPPEYRIQNPEPDEIVPEVSE